MQFKSKIIISLVVLSFILVGVFYAKKQSITLANNTTPIILGDVPSSDNLLINSALDDFANAQKQGQEQIKQIEITIQQKKQILDNTVIEVIKGNGKDWRVETITEKDPKLRTYQFIKREQPITTMPMTVETKVEEKK